MKKRFLYVVSMILCLSVLFAFSSCEYWEVELNGIDEYHYANSESGLTAFLLPNHDGFLKLFPYIEGDYQYYDHMNSQGCFEYALIYLKYNANEYEKAKTYFLENILLAEGSEEFYKGYVFQKRITKLSLNHTHLGGYSDELHTIIVVATRITGEYVREFSSFSDYMDAYFSFYNWEEGKIERESASVQESM